MSPLLRGVGGLSEEMRKSYKLCFGGDESIKTEKGILMETNSNRIHIPYAPTESADLYPDSDGKPMAVSDLHRRILIRTLQVLDTYFAKNPAAYVSGDILMYYVEGDPRQSVSPDVLVTFGLDKENRRTYLVWEEGKVPDFVMEFSSKSTYRNDLGRKMTLYASLGIQDYFLYDAEGLYLSSPLMGFTLVEGSYVPISAGPRSRFALCCSRFRFLCG